jgi:hypothetical protein
MAYGDSPLVNADKVHDSGFFLGNHHFPIESKFQLIADCIITEISKK